MSLSPRVAAILSAAVLLPGCLCAQPEPVVTDLQAWGTGDGVLHVRWVTEQLTRGRVQYGATADLGSVAEEDPACLRGTTNNRDSGTGWASNHRCDIAGVTEWPIWLRIAGGTAEGEAFESETITVPGPLEPRGRVARELIPLRVERGAWQLEAAPITVGVPFPDGALADTDSIRLLVGKSELPCQVQAVTRWHGSQSIKWLRVDFLCPPGDDEAYLQYGTEVTRRAVSPPERLADDLGGLSATLVDAEGKRHEARLGVVGMEESGPVKWVVKAEGQFVAADGAALGRFIVRRYVWPGLDADRYDLTFENDNTSREMTSIRSLHVQLPGNPAGLTVGDGEDIVELQKGQRVLQREDFEWVTEPGGEKGRRLKGVIETGEEAYLLRNFWEQWPSSVELGEEGARIGLCPELPEGFYSGRQDEDKLYYQIRDGLHTFRQGFAKTWELWRVSAAGVAASLDADRPIASVPSRWIEDSGALRRLAVAAREQFPGYDETLATGVDRYLEARDRAREYGMMNFGDWHGERTWNWGNLEYDLGHGFLTQFARTGKPEFCHRAEECVRHQRDVDTRHHADDARRIGQQWTHAIGHTAGYYPPEYKDMKVYASPGWSDNRGHIWSQGMLEHYLLGGDRRSWDCGLLISDWAAGPQVTNFRFGNAREPGWMTKLVMGAYLCTEDPFYLNAARIMLSKVHRQSLATGDRGFYYHELPGGHCDCEGEKHYGEAGFMLGVLMTGMKMYYEATGDETVAEDLVKTARFIVETMWVPQELGFRYTSCPRTGAGRSSAWIMMEGLAFAASRTGDPALAEVCRDALAAAWSTLPVTGKGAGYVICSSAQALAEMSVIPGESFADYLAAVDRALRSPGRRLLPTNVPNPDFEDSAQGWPSRGWAIERSEEVKHSGRASLEISGVKSGQNEYVNTTYDAAGSPFEIAWLRPGATYRLTAWLRVDQITPGTPAPSMRLAFRDAGGTRSGAATNAYDLERLGTWQKLSADVTLPEYNTRNYIALNTNSRESIETVMYLDDISLVPVERSAADRYDYHRLLAEDAQVGEGARVVEVTRPVAGRHIEGPGDVWWTVQVEEAGRYSLWAAVSEGARIGGAIVGDTELPGIRPPGELTWVRLGEVEVSAGAVGVRLVGLGEGARVTRVVLTDDPGSSVE